MIVPYWPSQPWFPVFKKLSLREPLYLHADPDPTPPLEATYPDVGRVVREAFARKSLEPDTINILVSSLANATLKQCNCAYKNGGNSVLKST